MPIKCVERTIVKLEFVHVEERRDALTIPGERPLRKKRLEYITDLLENGTFYRADFAYAKCAEDGKIYGVNGKHTYVALIQCKENVEMPDFPEGIPLCIEVFECDTKDELSTIFDNYDNPISNRTAGDKLGTQIAMRRDSLEGLDDKIIRAALNGVNYARATARDPREPKMGRWVLGELLQDDEVCDFCRYVQGFKDDSWDGWKIPAVCAAIYKSWRENEDVAQAVWEEALNETDENEDSDSRKYVNRMRTERGRKVKSPDWFYNESIRYWKRHRKSASTIAKRT